MGWFNDQIRQRMENDQEVLEDSFFRMANAVMDKWNTEYSRGGKALSQRALTDILRYYHEKPVEIPEEMTEFSEQMEFTFRPSGLMIRDVELEEGWQNDATGPMLGCLRESGTIVALMPRTVAGYSFRDPESGKTVRVTKKTAKRFEREAICFYRPLPMKRLGIPDLILYMKNSISHGDLILIAAASLAVTLLGLLVPRVYALLTGPVLQSRNLNLLMGIGMFLLGTAFSSQILSMIRSLLMERIDTKTGIAVESSVMMRILSLPISFFRHYASGDLANRAESVNTLCTTILDNILSVGLNSLMSLLYIGQIFTFAPALVWPSVAIIAITVTLSVVSALMQVDVSRKRMKLDAEDAGMTYAVLNAVQKIRLSGSEQRVFSRWARLYAQKARLQYNPPVFLKVNKVLTTAVSLIGTVVLYYMAIQAGVGNNEYYGFSAAYGQLSAAFTSLAGIAFAVADIRPILEMAEPILKAEPEVASDKETVTRVSGAIEMSHVSFRYSEKTPYILDDLSLKIRAGEYVAVVGRTGCGKSTLVRLLLGFEKPEKGAVYYDNRDLATLDPRSLRRQIGVVIQNGQLFQGDIFANITISAPQLTLDQAWEAAETAGIADDIREMPMGMQTMISEGQGGISGGQKQRLMIARAVAGKPKILIFDEATSALDNKTQRQVSEALDKLKCTRVIIAHRLSTIRNCDRILVMDDGRIIEEGTYDALIAEDGVFADLVARQRLDIPTKEPAEEENNP